jgi:hypothetical protein
MSTAAMPTTMRNLSVLVVLSFATFGVWVFSSAFLLAPLVKPGSSYPVYLGLVTFPDFLGLLLFGVWAFLVARLGHSLFTGPSAPRYRVAIVALTVFFFLYTRSVFILSNLSFEFVTRGLILTAIVAACAWYGLRRGPIL